MWDRGLQISSLANSNIIFDENYAIEKNFIATIIEYCNEKYRKNKYYNFKILSDIKNKNFSKFSNIILTDKNNIFNKNISNIIKFNRKNANSHNLIKTLTSIYFFN